MIRDFFEVERLRALIEGSKSGESDLFERSFFVSILALKALA